MPDPISRKNIASSSRFFSEPLGYNTEWALAKKKNQALKVWTFRRFENPRNAEARFYDWREITA